MPTEVTRDDDRTDDTADDTADERVGASGWPQTTYVMSYQSVEDLLPVAMKHGALHRERLRLFHSRGTLLMNSAKAAGAMLALHERFPCCSKSIAPTP